MHWYRGVSRRYIKNKIYQKTFVKIQENWNPKNKTHIEPCNRDAEYIWSRGLC